MHTRSRRARTGWKSSRSASDTTRPTRSSRAQASRGSGRRGCWKEHRTTIRGSARQQRAPRRSARSAIAPHGSSTSTTSRRTLARARQSHGRCATSAVPPARTRPDCSSSTSLPESSTTRRTATAPRRRSSSSSTARERSSCGRIRATEATTSSIPCDAAASSRAPPGRAALTPFVRATPDCRSSRTGHATRATSRTTPGRAS